MGETVLKTLIGWLDREAGLEHLIGWRDGILYEIVDFRLKQEVSNADRASCVSRIVVCTYITHDVYSI